jgi:hypothetical protein
LSFAEERIGPLAAIVTIVFYLLALYLLVLTITPENLFASIYSESLIKTTHQHLLLLVGFNTLIYRKYYDTSPILVGHHILIPLSSATVTTATAIAILWAEMVLTSPCSILWWILSTDSRLVCCNDRQFKGSAESYFEDREQVLLAEQTNWTLSVHLLPNSTGDERHMSLRPNAAATFPFHWQ